eukprot:1000536-Amphidinium_carterae.2
MPWSDPLLFRLHSEQEAIAHWGVLVGKVTAERAIALKRVRLCAKGISKLSKSSQCLAIALLRLCCCSTAGL